MCRRHGKIEGYAAVQQIREVERVSIRRGRLDDHHACRRGASEDIAVVPGGACEGRVAGPAVHGECVRAGASRQIHRLDAGERVTSRSCKRRRREREVDIRRFHHRVSTSATVKGIVPRPPREHVVTGEPRENVVLRIPDERVGKRCPGDVLQARLARQCQRQPSHDRLRRRHGQIDGHATIGKVREVERVGVGVRNLDDRHACRLRPGEDVGIVPGAAGERRVPRPTLHRERVRAGTGRKVRRFDPGQRVTSHACKRRRCERKVDVGRLGYRVGARPAVEGVVAEATGKRVIPSEP